MYNKYNHAHTLQATYNINHLVTTMYNPLPLLYNNAEFSDMEINYGAYDNVKTIKCQKMLVCMLSVTIRDMVAEFGDQRPVIDLCASKYDNFTIQAVFETMYGINTTYKAYPHRTTITVNCIDFADYLNAQDLVQHFITKFEKNGGGASFDGLTAAFVLAERICDSRFIEAAVKVMAQKLPKSVPNILVLHRRKYPIFRYLGRMLNPADEFMLRYKLISEDLGIFMAYMTCTTFNQMHPDDARRIIELKYIRQNLIWVNLLKNITYGGYMRGCIPIMD